MQNLFLILLLLLLLLIALQDFKDRAISWWTIPLSVMLYFFYLGDLGALNWTDIFWNLLLIGMNFLVLTLYFSIKKKKLLNIIDHFIGLGDLLFFLVCAFMFSFPNFVFFLCISFGTSILFFAISQTIKKEKDFQIPLAGVMSILLVIVFLSNEMLSLNFFHDLTFVNKLKLK